MLARATFLATLLAIPVAAAGGEPQVKISLSREDPNVRTGEATSGEPVEFHVWVDGPILRGAEFGLAIEGAEFLSFNTPREKGWLVLPIPNGPPRTISQVVPGDCANPPVLFGTLTVQPDEAGKPIIVDVIPSAQSNFALVLLCDNTPFNGLQVFPAGVNAPSEELKPHRVVAEEAGGGPKQGPKPAPEPSEASESSEAGSEPSDPKDADASAGD